MLNTDAVQICSRALGALDRMHKYEQSQMDKGIVNNLSDPIVCARRAANPTQIEALICACCWVASGQTMSAVSNTLIHYSDSCHVYMSFSVWLNQ